MSAERGGPVDGERSISGRACLPVLIAMIGIAALLISTFGVVLSAHGATTPKIRWVWPSNTVYVQTTLGAGWPVTKAISRWDDRSALVLKRVKRCPQGRSCITFKPGNRPGRTLATAFSWTLDGRISRCDIVIDKRAIAAARTSRLSTLSHEVGHCLGFAHVSNRRDVMCEFNYRDRPTGPSDRYLAALKRVYR